ncbi:hypothetical protein [Paenibacillus amylolyticus]|uniref:hypothetical protein n=1 Tax=Paenibacillus amylolyticus TaxID=1451 RepID=UPI003EBF5A67
MKVVIDYKFDWRAMGWNAYTPIMVIIFVAVYSFFANKDFRLLASIHEVLLPVFAAWWSVFIFQDILEEEGSEVIFSYSVSRWRLGTVRVLVFLGIYVLLIAIDSLYMSWISGFNWTVKLIQYSSQSFFYACFGFLLMAILRNCSWAILVVASYASFQILTRGSVFPLSSIYFFDVREPVLNAIAGKLLIIIFMAIIMLLISQYILGRTEKYSE